VWSGNALRRPLRVALLVVVLACFAAIFLTAPLLRHNLRYAGISNHTIHKVGHVVVYGVLAVLLAKGLGNGWVLSGLLCFAVSAAAEVQQLFVRDRVASWADAGVNLAAIAAALALAWLGEQAARVPSAP
jgi:VanZ family protein